MKFKRIVSGSITAALAAASVVLGAPAAQASTPPPAAPPGYAIFYRVINASHVNNYINYADPIARCYATGGHCSISSTYSESIDISLNLGVTRAFVATSLGVTSSTSRSISVSCSSPTLPAGRAWTAYPVGQFYTYWIDEEIHAGIYVSHQKSSALHAFIPYPNQVACS